MDNPDRVAIARLISLCRRIELLVADFYDLLASQHAFEPELAKLWKRMAAEERGHAGQFDVLARLDPETLAVVEASHARAEQLLAEVKQRLERSRAEPPSPERALWDMAALELRYSDLHATTAVGFRDPNQKRFFEAMARGDLEHRERLRQVLRDRRRTSDPQLAAVATGTDDLPPS